MQGIHKKTTRCKLEFQQMRAHQPTNYQQFLFILLHLSSRIHSSFFLLIIIAVVCVRGRESGARGSAGVSSATSAAGAAAAAAASAMPRLSRCAAAAFCRAVPRSLSNSWSSRLGVQHTTALLARLVGAWPAGAAGAVSSAVVVAGTTAITVACICCCFIWFQWFLAFCFCFPLSISLLFVLFLFSFVFLHLSSFLRVFLFFL